MKPFAYQRHLDAAGATLALNEGARAIAGGTNLLDLMKLEVETPERLSDISRLPLTQIESDGAGLRVGALVTNSDCAADLRIRRDYPVLARAILAGATGQLRNKATTGGNLCQRTRCTYFTDLAQPCNKRAPGSGCGAREGFNRIHAVLGASDACIATYPGDMAVGLAALDAAVVIENAQGARSVPVREFHRLPGDEPHRDNILEPEDLITAVILPTPVGGRQLYRKVRDRSSYSFALVSVAAIVVVEAGRIAKAQLAFGGLAHKPWHDPAIDRLLSGATPSKALFDEAANLLLNDARGFGHNDFKIPLARRTLRAVLTEATGV